MVHPIHQPDLRANKRWLQTLCGYTLCIAFVAIFVNLYEVFALTKDLIGDRGILMAPFIVVGAVLVTTLSLATWLPGREKKWLPISFGCICCLLALLIPDPAIPIKRIHVSEYLLLSLVVRWTLARQTRGKGLLVSSILLSILFGIHDEILQGFHPLRTYGLRDMLTNGLAGFGGSLIWHGLNLFTTSADHDETGFSLLLALYYSWLSLSVLAFVVPLVAFRQESIPTWTILPLAATLVCWSCMTGGQNSGSKQPINSVSLCSVSMLFYPMINHATPLVFY